MQPMRLLLAAFLLPGLMGCGATLVLLRVGLQPPALHFESATCSSATADGVTIIATYRVANPNPVPLSFDGASVAYLMNGAKLFDAEVVSTAQLPASTTTTLTLPVRVNFSALPDLTKLAENQDELLYDVESTLTFRSSAGDLGLPVKWSGTIPLPKPPRVTFSGVHVDRMGFSNAQLALLLTVENPNIFIQAFEAVNARLTFEGQVIANVATKAPHDVARQGPTEVSVPVEAAIASPSITQALLTNASMFRLEGTVRVDGKDLPVDGTAALK